MQLPNGGHLQPNSGRIRGNLTISIEFRANSARKSNCLAASIRELGPFLPQSFQIEFLGKREV